MRYCESVTLFIFVNLFILSLFLKSEICQINP